MEVVNMSELFNRNSLYFRKDFEILAEKLDSKSEYMLDFEGIMNLSPSSAHELLLIKKRGFNIKIENLNENLKLLLEGQKKIRKIDINLY